MIQPRDLMTSSHIVEEVADDHPCQRCHCLCHRPGARRREVAPKGLHAPRIVLYKAEGQWQDRAGGFQPFVFASPDVNATYQELSGRGVEFTAPPKREPWGMWAQFKDPDGNEFGLYEEPAP